MTQPTPPTVLSLGSPAELAAVVPHLLGFHPVESLVLVGAAGPRRRVGLTVRTGLDQAVAEPAAVGALCDAVRRSGATAAFVVVVSASAAGARGRRRLPHRRVVEQVRRTELEVIEAILTDGTRCWSYLCSEADCCPPDGLPVTPSDSDRIAAAFTAAGSAVMADRQAVVDVVRPVAADQALPVRAAMARARGWESQLSRAAAAGWLDRCLERWVAAYDDPRARIDVDTAARLSRLLRRIPLRDRVILRWVVDLPVVEPVDAAVAPEQRRPWGSARADAWRRLLLDVARLTLPPDDPPICTLFACAAYHDGDGVLVEAALDRALGTDPDYSLARLLRDLLERQTHPRELVRGWRAAAGGL